VEYHPVPVLPIRGTGYPDIKYLNSLTRGIAPRPGSNSLYSPIVIFDVIPRSGFISLIASPIQRSNSLETPKSGGNRHCRASLDLKMPTLATFQTGENVKSLQFQSGKSDVHKIW